MAQSFVSKVMEGIAQMFWAGGRHTDTMLIGCNLKEECDLSTVDHTVSMQCPRCISADVQGTVRVLVENDDGTTSFECLTVPVTWLPMRNVVRVHRFLNDVTRVEGTAQIYLENGEIVRGIKVRK